MVINIQSHRWRKLPTTVSLPITESFYSSFFFFLWPLGSYWSEVILYTQKIAEIFFTLNAPLDIQLLFVVIPLNVCVCVFVLELVIPLRASSVADECGFPPKDISWLKVFLTFFQKVMGTLDDCKLLFRIHWKIFFSWTTKMIHFCFNKKKCISNRIRLQLNGNALKVGGVLLYSERFAKNNNFSMITFSTSYYWNASIDMIHWLFISAKQEHILQRNESYFHFPF